jgi:predicted nucleic acid-binding protein
MHPADPCNLVLDTNVVLDLLWFDDPGVTPLAAALDAGRVRMVSCPALREELARQLASARLARWAQTPSHAAEALERHDAWARIGRLVPTPVAPTCPALRCSDADDQVFFDLALAQRADWLLSHDRALLKLARRARPMGLRIATPATWATEASPAGPPAPGPAAPATLPAA